MKAQLKDTTIEYALEYVKNFYTNHGGAVVDRVTITPYRAFAKYFNVTISYHLKE